MGLRDPNDQERPQQPEISVRFHNFLSSAPTSAPVTSNYFFNVRTNFTTEAMSSLLSLPS
jgi:hypothetical protein